MKILVFILLALTISCSSQEKVYQSVFEEAFPNLNFEQPVDIQSPKDGSNRLFVLSQPGIIYVFDNDQNTKQKEVFLDIRGKVLFGGEQGLLGLAFHPDYIENGYFYLDYTTNNPRRTVISRFKVSANDPSKADPESELVLLEVEQPYSNHNGGQISFGPDGYFYISLGDGGSGGDPLNAGQDLTMLLGSLLRIDVDNASDGRNYAIPDDNPLKGNNEGFKEEIYAYGLRNVWRFSFDNQNRLWAADVGQNKWEEINLIEKGKNYGWRIMEGKHCFNPETNCDTTGLVLPIWEYGHNDMGGYSITGGFVYEGNSVPSLKGKYIFADYVVGKIWSLDYKDGKVTNKLLAQTNHLISTFGVDQNNELYFADHNSGKLYRFVFRE
ncbi:MAG TPA: PQQ-dependent sugar dehydrogenase [Ignavibacteriaceae bacterium]|nr:PQQ-dependent sugar dehydrogenase [Ignavibacteriaceae bacterium]